MLQGVHKKHLYDIIFERVTNNWTIRFDVSPGMTKLFIFEGCFEKIEYCIYRKIRLY